MFEGCWGWLRMDTFLYSSLGKCHYIRNRISGLHRSVNSCLLNMLVFISMPIFSTRWKSFLEFYSNIFTVNKDIYSLSLICKTKQADSFLCPFIEKVSFPSSIPHCENYAWRSQGIPMMCIENYQAWNISEKYCDLRHPIISIFYFSFLTHWSYLLK